MGSTINANMSTPTVKPKESGNTQGNQQSLYENCVFDNKDQKALRDAMKAQEALRHQRFAIVEKVPYETNGNTEIKLGTALNFPTSVYLNKGHYTLYKNSAGENLGFEEQITPNAKILVYIPEKGSDLDIGYTRIKTGSNNLPIETTQRILEITEGGNVSTYFETEAENIFVNKKDGRLIAYDAYGSRLIPNEEAKKEFEEKREKALEIIKQNSEGFFKATGGKVNLSEELKTFGEDNISVESSYDDDTGGQYYQSCEETKAESRKIYEELGGKFYLAHGCNNRKRAIDLNYNIDLSDSPLTIARIIIHELGHAKDNDGEDSIQEEADVERVARNFVDYVKNPNVFKYKSYEDNQKFIAFLNTYREKGYAATSPGHGQ